MSRKKFCKNLKFLKNKRKRAFREKGYMLKYLSLIHISRMDDGKVIGDPTESALLEMVRKCGVDDDFLRGAMEPVSYTHLRLFWHT